MKNTKKNYSDFAFIADLELLKGYQVRESKEIDKIEKAWERLTKARHSDFKFKLITEALTTMHEDGFRPACCLYTIIANFDSIFEGDF